MTSLRTIPLSSLCLAALLVTGCPEEPAPESPPVCEDASDPVVAECADDTFEPNETLADAPDLIELSWGQTGVSCDGDTDLWYFEDPLAAGMDHGQVIIEWDSCDSTLQVRALDNNGDEIVDIERGNLDDERRQSVIFRDGALGYVEVTNPEAAQGPIRYSVSYVLWSDEDSR